MDGRRVERSVEFDRDVAHGELNFAKLCPRDHPQLLPISPIAAVPLPFLVFPRQDLPLNRTPSHLSLYRDETKNWPTRSILLSHPYPLFFPAFFPFHFLLVFLQSSFPRKLIKTATGDETAKLEYRNRRVESCNSFQPNGTTHVRFRESSFLQIR